MPERMPLTTTLATLDQPACPPWCASHSDRPRVVATSGQTILAYSPEEGVRRWFPTVAPFLTAAELADVAERLAAQRCRLTGGAV